MLAQPTPPNTLSAQLTGRDRSILVVSVSATAVPDSRMAPYEPVHRFSGVVTIKREDVGQNAFRCSTGEP